MKKKNKKKDFPGYRILPYDPANEISDEEYYSDPAILESLKEQKAFYEEKAAEAQGQNQTYNDWVEIFDSEIKDFISRSKL